MARDKGTGSVTWNESKQRWIGTIEAGWTTRGTRRRISVSAKTKRECLQNLKAKQAQIARHGTPTDENHTSTVKAYADEWLELQASRLDPSALIVARSALTQWIIPTIGHRKLTLIAARDIRAVDKAIRAAGRSESTVARYHNVLMKMLKDATRDGYPVTQSALMAEAVTPSKSDREPLTLPEVNAVLEQASMEPDYSRWLAAFYAALRPAEALGLEWNRIDFDLGGWGAMDISWQLKALPYNRPRDASSGFKYPIGYEHRQIFKAWHWVRPKTDAGERWIPLHPILREELLLWRDKCPGDYGLVWPNLTGEKARAYGGPREDKVDRAAWKRLCRQAGVTDSKGNSYDLYSARHSAAGFLRDAGTPEEVITMIMGHTSIRSTQAYLHATVESAGRYLEAATKEIAAPIRAVALE